MISSSSDFVGRRSQLALLDADLDQVRRSGRGRFVLLCGRRRVGKSRLVSEFLRRHPDVPAVFHAATPAAPDRELRRFGTSVERSSTAAAALVRSGTSFTGWEGALATVAMAAAEPCVIVIDELPYLIDGRPDIEAELQHVWDQVLEHRPVLLIAIGSDLAMMAALTNHGRPLYGRPTRQVVLDPLSVAEVGDLLTLAPADAIDAALVVGGFPLVARSWPPGAHRSAFLGEALSDPTSPLIVTGERALAAEFPDPAARLTLGAVGAGEATFTTVAQRTGLPATTLRRTLDVLQSKRIVTADRPLSTHPAPKLTRLRISDPYLRFWLRFVEPGLEEIERGRADLALDRVATGWDTYRGVAVEPLVRTALDRMIPDERLGGTRQIGGYWNRTNAIEVDLVGVDDPRSPRRVEMIGSVKWRDSAPFGRSDLAALARVRDQVPGADDRTALLAVSRTGADAPGLDAVLGPAEIVDALR